MLVARGECPFLVKITHAQKTGAIGVIVGDNIDENGLIK